MHISIVYSANNNYIPYAYCSLMSLLAHRQTAAICHVYVLHTDVTAENQGFLRKLQTKALQVTFVDCRPMKSRLEQLSLNLTYHFTIETYYRFFLAELLPQLDKVLYLDADTLICHDIADLWNIAVEDYYLAATRDLEIIRVSAEGKSADVSYFKDILQLQDIHQYFQAGVMSVNLKKWRQDNLQQKLLDRLACIKNPLYVDQDILNSVCQGHIKFIPQNWDYTWHLPFMDQAYRSTLPEPYAEQYQAAQQNPYIIHFTGEKMKPENLPAEPESRLFWRYAAQSPYFEQLRERMQREQIKQFQFVQKNRWKLWRYWLLTKIAFGNFRQRYVTKYNNLRKKIERFLNQEVQI